MVTAANGEKQPLLECNKLEDTLLKYSQTHFAHAEGLKFMQEPLQHLLQYDRLTPFGDQVTKGGTIGTLHMFDEPIRAILQNLHKKTPEPNPLCPLLDYLALLDGIKKWPE